MGEAGEEEDNMRNVTNVEDDLDEGGREMGMRLMTMGLGMVELKRKVREIKDTEIRLFKNMHIDKD
jgi:L-arabinose isomerase